VFNVSLAGSRLRLRENNRGLVIKAARKVLLRDGAARFSLRAVARELGCSPGTIYTYYAGRDAMISAVVDASFARLGRQLKKAKAPRDGAASMRRGGETYIEFGLSHPEDYMIAFMLPSAARKPGYRPHDAYLGVRNMIAGAVEKGELAGDPDEIVQVMWTALHGLVSLLIQRPHFPWVPRKRLIEATLDAIMNNLQAHKPRP